MGAVCDRDAKTDGNIGGNGADIRHIHHLRGQLTELQHVLQGTNGASLIGIQGEGGGEHQLMCLQETAALLAGDGFAKISGSQYGLHETGRFFRN